MQYWVRGVNLIGRNFSYPAEWLSEVIQTHKNLHGNTATSAVYKANQDVLEKVAAMAIEVLTELLYEDLGARLVPDSELYASCLREFSGLGADIERLKVAKHSLGEKAKSGAISVEDLLVDSNTIDQKLAEYTSHQAEVRVQIERIENGDRLLMVPLPDHLGDEDMEIDLEQVKQQVLGLSVGQRPSTARTRVRSWITVPELAEVAGVSRRTASSWCRIDGKGFTGSGVSPFRTSQIPAVELSGTRSIIPAAALSPKWLEEDPRREDILNLTMCDWPAANLWHSFRKADHPLPEWLENELAAFERQLASVGTS